MPQGYFISFGKDEELFTSNYYFQTFGTLRVKAQYIVYAYYLHLCRYSK